MRTFKHHQDDKGHFFWLWSDDQGEVAAFTQFLDQHGIPYSVNPVDDDDDHLLCVMASMVKLTFANA